MTHEEMTSAIRSLAPDAEWTLSGDNYADLNWLSEGNPPTLSAIEAEIVNLEAKKAQAKIDQENAKAAAEAKLTALGLTAEDLKALGL
jgi:hypothetical protein